MKDIEEVISLMDKLHTLVSDRDKIGDFIINYDKLDQLWDVPIRLNDIKNVCQEALIYFSKISNKMGSNYQNIKETVNSGLRKIDNLVKKYKILLKKYGSPESIFIELEKDRANDLKFVQEELSNLLEDIESSLKKIRRILRRFDAKSKFKGRRFFNIKELIKTGLQKANEAQNLIRKLEEYLDDIIVTMGSISTFQDEGEKLTRDCYFIFSQLEGAMSNGLWVKDFVEILTGLQSVTGELSSGTILFKFEEENPEIQPSIVTLDEIFFRYPPFEPIAQKRKINVPTKYGNVTIPIAGNYIWFIIGKNTNLDKMFNTLIINGESKSKGMYGELKEVNPIDILKLNRNELIIKIGGEGFFVRVKYGSKKLMELIKTVKLPRNNPEKAEKILQQNYEQLIGRTGKAYKCTDLTYVWYCRRGFGMSSDPWDLNCPFDCSSQYKKKGKCVFWSYNRRIFPKIFGILNRKIFGLEVLAYEERFGVLSPIKGKGVRIQEVYEGVQWNMPSDFGSGMPVYVEFDKGLVKTLPRTNVIGFTFPYTLLKTLILELLDPEITPKPHFLANSEKLLSLDYLLLSKYFIWEHTLHGRRSYQFFRKNKDRIIKEYRKFLKDVTSSVEIQEKIAEFAAKVIAHTLSHLFLFFVSKELEIEYKDLIYITNIDPEEDKIFVIIAENSPLGVIDLVDHAERRFGSITNMLSEFVNEIINLLEQHENDLKSYWVEIEKARNRYFATRIGFELTEVAEMLKEYYIEFIQNGLILDLYNFSLHVHLADIVSKLSKDTGVEYNKILTELGNILQFSGPIYCVDGCTSCVMIESGCTSSISQNLELSRHITSWFLKLICGREKITAKGGKLGEILLKRVPSKNIFVVTPYLDEDGVYLLNELSKKGVDVTLVTRKETFEKYNKKLDRINTYLFNVPRHEKIYIIDDKILIDTTWNLTLSTQSTNRFEIKILDPSKLNSLKSQILAKSKRSDFYV